MKKKCTFLFYLDTYISCAVMVNPQWEQFANTYLT